jgi:hypothetical protein
MVKHTRLFQTFNTYVDPTYGQDTFHTPSCSALDQPTINRATPPEDNLLHLRTLHGPTATKGFRQTAATISMSPRTACSYHLNRRCGNAVEPSSTFSNTAPSTQQHLIKTRPSSCWHIPRTTFPSLAIPAPLSYIVASTAPYSDSKAAQHGCSISYVTASHCRLQPVQLASPPPPHLHSSSPPPQTFAPARTVTTGLPAACLPELLKPHRFLMLLWSCSLWPLCWGAFPACCSCWG